MGSRGGGAQCIEGLMAGVPTRRLLWELAHANGVRGDALSVSGDCALHHTLVRAPTGLAALAAVCAYVALAEHKLGQRYVDIRMRRSSCSSGRTSGDPHTAHGRTARSRGAPLNGWMLPTSPWEIKGPGAGKRRLREEAAAQEASCCSDSSLPLVSLLLVSLPAARGKRSANREVQHTRQNRLERC